MGFARVFAARCVSRSRAVPRLRRAWIALAVCVACEPKLGNRGPSYAVEQLRRAVVTNDIALLNTVTDERLSAHIVYFHGTERAVALSGHSHGGVVETISPRFFAVTYDAMENQPYDPLPRFRAAREWLGNGRCAQGSAVPLPESFAQLTAVDRDWSEKLQRRHAQVAGVLARAFAIRFQCAAGIPLTVVFVASPESSQPPKILAIERASG